MSIYLLLGLSFLCVLIANYITRIGMYPPILYHPGLPKFALLTNKQLRRFYIITPPDSNIITKSGFAVYLLQCVFFIIISILSILHLIFNILSFENQSLIYDIWKISSIVSIIASFVIDEIICQVNKHKKIK